MCFKNGQSGRIMIAALESGSGKTSITCALLNIFAEQVRFTHWYFGHWHMDAELGEKYTALYQKVIPLP